MSSTKTWDWFESSDSQKEVKQEFLTPPTLKHHRNSKKNSKSDEVRRNMCLRSHRWLSMMQHKGSWAPLWMLCSLQHRFGWAPQFILTAFLFFLIYLASSRTFIFNFSLSASVSLSHSRTNTHLNTHTLIHNESVRWSPHSRIILCHWVVFITPSISQPPEYVSLFSGPRPPNCPPVIH